MLRKLNQKSLNGGPTLAPVLYQVFTHSEYPSYLFKVLGKCIHISSLSTETIISRYIFISFKFTEFANGRDVADMMKYIVRNAKDNKLDNLKLLARLAYIHLLHILDIEHGDIAGENFLVIERRKQSNSKWYLLIGDFFLAESRSDLIDYQSQSQKGEIVLKDWKLYGEMCKDFFPDKVFLDNDRTKPLIEE